eukprot:14057256-Heterocapsa_arctica.AAC.1
MCIRDSRGPARTAGASAGALRRGSAGAVALPVSRLSVRSGTAHPRSALRGRGQQGRHRDALG